jgi:hypothetical protein
MVCPLCSTVLEHKDNLGKPEETLIKPAMYPNVREVTRTLNFIIKLYIFLAIVLELVLIIINYFTYRGFRWSEISGIAILYFYMTLRYSIQKNTGLKRVITMQVVFGALFTVCIDFIIGYRGWSVDFVIPSAILMLDLAIVILMLINIENWQSYILLQMMNVIFSIIIVILWKVGIIHFPILTIIAAGISVIFFIGTLIFGDRKAKNELKRRFHV